MNYNDGSTSAFDSPLLLVEFLATLGKQFTSYNMYYYTYVCLSSPWPMFPHSFGILANAQRVMTTYRPCTLSLYYAAPPASRPSFLPSVSLLFFPSSFVAYRHGLRAALVAMTARSKRCSILYIHNDTTKDLRFSLLTPLRFSIVIPPAYVATIKT